MRRAGGLTLLETVVVVAILGVVVGALVPMLVTRREGTRSEETAEALRRLKRGIVALPGPGGGEGDGGGPGFLSDMGRLPDSLPQLVVPGGAPSFARDPALRLGAGWRGPYVDARRGEVARDAFGRALWYSRSDTSPAPGTTWAGFVRSAGADGAHGSPDDLVAPLLPHEVGAEVRGFVVHASGRPLAHGPVSVAFRRDGSVVDTAVSSDSLGLYSLPPVAPGPVAARLPDAPPANRTAFLRGSATTTGLFDQNVLFRIQNVTGREETLTSLTATWSGTDACYREVAVDGAVVWSGIRCSGETASFSPTVALPPGAAAEGSVALRRIVLDARAPPLPELLLAAGTEAGEATVALNEWREGGGTGPRADMRGITITVTLSDGLTATFTP